MIILDNCAIHHVQEVVDMVEGVGAIVHFLPPYSPDLNPIEEAFSKVKSEMKNLGETTDITDTETILLMAFASITAQDCREWVSHCNIYNT